MDRHETSRRESLEEVEMRPMLNMLYVFTETITYMPRGAHPAGAVEWAPIFPIRSEHRVT